MASLQRLVIVMMILKTLLDIVKKGTLGIVGIFIKI